MNPSDFIFTNIYKGSLAKGVEEKIAHEQAQIGMDDYYKNKFVNASKLINDKITMAVKLQKKVGGEK